ncbi:MAG: ATP-binding protein [Tannerella sp.]|jgi:predicted ATP-dependent endonuclease of OLD family|nr:ATP-binding protein [Tannerella sp.]
MDKWIKSISGEIPHTNRTVKIDLDGRNLIVTGANGSGKTSFLREVYRKVELLVVRKQTDLPEMKHKLTYRQSVLDSAQTGTAEHSHAKRDVHYLKSIIDALENGLQVDIPDPIRFSSMYDNRTAVIRFFEEKRLSEIVQPVTAKAVSVEEERAGQQNAANKFANDLEQHLVNLKSRQAMAVAIDKNQELADEIERWFVDFGRNLKILFEDPGVALKFNPDDFRFSICQENKPPYTFQTLSAGYRAIFDIYAELIMRMEYFKISPEELTGVVLIDEIDSHLHVSLQRLILPFFAGSFPKIQFIVTTHSPFVLMSTPDTVVFDLAKNEPITEDLSYYTYSAVMKGLWNVKPISVNLENTIREIAEIVNAGQKDLSRLRELTDRVKGREDVLDSESKAFYLLGLETLEEEGGGHV